MSAIENAKVHGYPGEQRGLPWFESDADRYAFAQVQATIALAEQQRTANLIALLSLSGPQAADLSIIAGVTLDAWDAIRREVAEGLGI